MRRAVDEARFDGQRQTLLFSYAPSDKQDLPREFDRLNRPAVFHLTGRLTGTPHSYAVTSQDATEFLQSLEAKTEDSPNFLLDKLKQHDLLVLGSHRLDWLMRAFAGQTRGGRRLEGAIGPWSGDGDVVFLQHVGAGARIYRGAGAAGFVEELYRRCSDSLPASKQTDASREQPRPDPPSSQGGITGAVLLSFVGHDRRAAESLRRELDRAGVDVVMDRDDAPVDESTTRRIRSAIGESAVFVPLISAQALRASRRFFRPEWTDAVLDAQDTAPHGSFVVPVVIDDTPKTASALPRGFGQRDWEPLPDGKPTPRFVREIVELQRRYRSASFV